MHGRLEYGHGRARAEDQISDLSRDARTIMVGSLLNRVDSDWVRKWFEPVGPVAAVRVIRDRRGVSRGNAYVEFDNIEDVPKALLMGGRTMCTRHPACACSGYPVTVARSGAEANYAKDAEEEEAKALIPDTLYFGDLPDGFSEDDVRSLAGALGGVTDVRLHRGNPKDAAAASASAAGSGASEASSAQQSGLLWAEVKFSAEEIAAVALQALANRPVGGKALIMGVMRVDGDVQRPDGRIFAPWDPEKTRLSAAQKAEFIQKLTHQTQDAAMSLSQKVGSAGITYASAAAALPVVGPSGNIISGHVEDEGDGGENPHLRGAPSACFVIENLFTDDTWRELDFGPAARGESLRVLVKDDVVGECDRKGTVLHAKLLRPGRALDGRRAVPGPARSKPAEPTEAAAGDSAPPAKRMRPDAAAEACDAAPAGSANGSVAASAAAAVEEPGAAAAADPAAPVVLVGPDAGSVADVGVAGLEEDEATISAGRVAIMMESRELAQAAAMAAAGRYYGGRRITVRYIPEVDYVQLYPEAARRVEKQAEKIRRRERRQKRKREEEEARARGDDARRSDRGDGHSGVHTSSSSSRAHEGYSRASSSAGGGADRRGDRRHGYSDYSGGRDGGGYGRSGGYGRRR